MGSHYIFCIIELCFILQQREQNPMNYGLRKGIYNSNMKANTGMQVGNQACKSYLNRR